LDHALHHVLEPSQEYDLALTVTSGRWPAGIAGHAFIIGPSQPALVNFVWAGTGIVTRVDLAPDAEGRPHWRSKRLVTPDTTLLYSLAQGVEPAAFGSILTGAGIALTNTSPHFFGDRLLLTFDQQRPAEFDPVTLEFKTYVGARSEYPAIKPHPVFPEIATTAHPVEDLDEGCMWWCNILMAPLGTSKSSFEAPLHVVRWDGHGALDTWSVPGARITQGIHEVTVTQDYVIFTEVGFQHETGAIAGRGRTKTHPPYTDIYLVAKRDLTAANRGKAVPHTHARVPFESFHEFADYRQDGDDVTMYIAHSNGWEINYAITGQDTVWGTDRAPTTGLYGFLSAPVDASPVGRYVIDGRTGEVKDSKLFVDPARHWATLLYARDMRRPAIERGRYLWQAYNGCDPEMLITRVVEMYRDHPYRIVPVDALPATEIPSTLVCIALDTMTEQSSWTFPEGTFGQSPVYVPDEQRGGEGWVVVFLQHRDRTELLVFDALSLGKGPIAVASAPGLKQSFQVHSGYMPAIRSRDSGYRRSFAADFGDDWRRLPADAQRVIAPLLGAFA
jgi:carotenoid cleavage dioxygenase-like enzyme